MAVNQIFIALSTVVAFQAPPVSQLPATPAPAGTETTRYCLRVDPITGSRIETIQCRTREEWAQLEVDVDKEWAENGVRTQG